MWRTLQINKKTILDRSFCYVKTRNGASRRWDCRGVKPKSTAHFGIAASHFKGLDAGIVSNFLIRDSAPSVIIFTIEQIGSNQLYFRRFKQGGDQKWKTCRRSWRNSKKDKKSSKVIFDISGKISRSRELEQQTSAQKFWELPSEERTPVLKSIRILSDLLREWNEFLKELEEYQTGVQLCTETEEADGELLMEARALGQSLNKRLGHLEVRNLLGGEQDPNDAIVMIHSGAGGTESADWAAMLFRMYQRWAEEHAFTVEVLDYLPAEEAGLKSATFSVSGDYIFGNMKAENGVHRLVRISPFDAAKRRHTSFASVFVYPDIEEDIEVEINDADLRIETYRAQGAGGQHINTTDSAVRITHLPSGIVVQCQNERSQHKNRSSAIKVLRARLYEKERLEREAEKDKVNAQKQQIAFGSQIRSYVLHPYQMVKDHRTGHETGNAQKVLDGDLDGFMEQALLQKVV